MASLVPAIVSVSGAKVVHGDVLALSKVGVTDVMSTSDVIVTVVVDGFVMASSVLAVISSALNAIVTVHLFVDASIHMLRYGIGDTFVSFSEVEVRLASIDGARVVIVTPFVHGDSDTSRYWVKSGLFGVADKFVSAVNKIFTHVEVDLVKASVSSNSGFDARVIGTIDEIVTIDFVLASFLVNVNSFGGGVFLGPASVLGTSHTVVTSRLNGNVIAISFGIASIFGTISSVVAAREIDSLVTSVDIDIFSNSGFGEARVFVALGALDATNRGIYFVRTMSRRNVASIGSTFDVVGAHIVSLDSGVDNLESEASSGRARGIEEEIISNSSLELVIRSRRRISLARIDDVSNASP